MYIYLLLKLDIKQHQIHSMGQPLSHFLPRRCGTASSAPLMSSMSDALDIVFGYGTGRKKLWLEFSGIF